MVKEVEVAIKINKSAKFILPLVANISTNSLINHHTFVNTYIELPDILILESNSICEDWQNIPTLIEEIILENKVLYKCKIPLQFQKDFDNFITGRYSEFSKIAKEIVCIRNNNGRRKGVENTTIYKILYKTPDRKQFLEERLGVRLDTEAELYSIPNIEEEMYGGERIKV